MDVICLYDENGLSAKDWADNGYKVYCYDLLHEKERVEGNITYVPWDANGSSEDLIHRHKGNTKIVLGFPPCTDLAISGAAWFKTKAEKDKLFQEKAVAMCILVEYVANRLNAPYVIENPVSVLATKWRAPDHRFHPYEYGGYLPENDIHPKYPDYIAPRDAYPKKTCYWTGNGFKMPEKKPVVPEEGYSRQHRLLGGKSAKTKSIRSCSPRGIARAIYEANK